MYETLIRQQEIVRDVLPTVDDAITRLKEIEEKKHKRRLIQVEVSRKAREAKVKRKAEEMEAEKEGEASGERPEKAAAPNNIATEAEGASATSDSASALKRKAEEMDGEKDGETLAKKPKGDQEDASVGKASAKDAEGTNATVNTTPTIAEVATRPAEASSKAPSPAPAGALKAAPLPERKYSSTKPAVQSRGHTSYLTFAFLIPSKVAIQTQNGGSVQEPTQTQEEGSVRDSFASEYSQVPTQDLIQL